MPSVVKIDISPLCNLRCTVCVHAIPNGDEALERQFFHADQKMSVAQYQKIIDEVRSSVSAVFLHYLGDPLMHPNLDEMSAYASQANVNTSFSTNFSYDLSDARLEKLARSGLTGVRICVDGLSQEKYQRTRINGRIDRVISNLKRLCEIKRQYGLRHPKIEVQYLTFDYNLDELEEARRLFAEIGVDHVTTFPGWLGNYTNLNPDKFDVLGPKRKSVFPGCYVPFFSMVIKYNGDVIPVSYTHLRAHET